MLYEATFIARQDLSNQAVDELANKFESILKENSANVVKREYWGLRDLAYKINKTKKGHYFFLGIDGNGDAVAELKRKAALDEDVLRHLIVSTKEIEEGDSVIIKKDEDKKV